MRKTYYFKAFLLFFAIAFSFLSIRDGSAAPKEGERLPSFSLVVPANDSYKQYLGIREDLPFLPTRVDGRMLIIEIFSMYCPWCQKEAPEVNKLHALIEGNPKLKGSVKIIGIGAGNSKYEVEVFKDNYKVPFPLFPDEDLKIHKALGEPMTPYFFAVKLTDAGDKISYSKLGSFGKAEDFLALIVKLAELE